MVEKFRLNSAARSAARATAAWVRRASSSSSLMTSSARSLVLRGQVALGLVGQLPGLLQLGVHLGEFEHRQLLPRPDRLALVDADLADDAGDLERQPQFLAGRDHAAGQHGRLCRTGRHGGGADPGGRADRSRLRRPAGDDQQGQQGALPQPGRSANGDHAT